MTIARQMTFIQGQGCVSNLSTVYLPIARTILNLLHSELGTTVEVHMADARADFADLDLDARS